MRIIAIDPGYERVGIALLEQENKSKETLIHSECFKTDSKLPLPDRLHLIAKRVESLIKEFHPEVLAIESLFFKNNKTTGMGVSEARGAIITQATGHGIPVHEILPIHVKTATTGYGKASKSDVHRMVSKLILLPDKKMLDDEIDAIAIGLTYFAMRR